ncbi:MAG: HAD family hydrolase [Chloroflexota bacterium]
MPCDAIVCDWNGTLTRDRDERPLLESIAVDLFKASIPLHPLRMARILKARRQLYALYTGRHQSADEDPVVQMVRIYNESVVGGMPVSLIHRATGRYAGRQETQSGLEHRLLRPVSTCHDTGKTTGILSSGYGYGIRSILQAAGYSRAFDFCEANDFKERDGKAIGLDLIIYRNKSSVLLGLLRDKNINEKMLVYIGDSEDDAGCLEIAGHPVVAFLTPDGLKQKFAREYRAFVPRDETDLARYLRDV